VLINHTKKYIYIRNPKTGSTSLQYFLIKNSNDDIQYSGMPFINIDSNITNFEFANHPTIQNIIDSKIMSEEDILNYDKYVIVRNPIDRFLSACYHFVKAPEHCHIKINNMSNKNEVVSKILEHYDHNIWYDVAFVPQENWIIHNGIKLNKLFKYEDINFMAKKLTNIDCNIPYNYRSDVREDNKKEELSNELLDHIEFIYKNDFVLYNSVQNLDF
jgi:hypothetical protein